MTVILCMFLFARLFKSIGTRCGKQLENYRYTINKDTSIAYWRNDSDIKFYPSDSIFSIQKEKSTLFLGFRALSRKAYS